MYKPFIFFFMILFTISCTLSADENSPGFLSFQMKAQWVPGFEINDFASQPFTGVAPLLFHGVTLGGSISSLLGGNLYIGVNCLGMYEDNSASGGDDFYGAAIGGLWNELIWTIGKYFAGGIHFGYPCGLVMSSLNGSSEISGVIGIEPAISLYYRFGRFQVQLMPGWFLSLIDNFNGKLMPCGPELILTAGVLL